MSGAPGGRAGRSWAGRNIAFAVLVAMLAPEPSAGASPRAEPAPLIRGAAVHPAAEFPATRAARLVLTSQSTWVPPGATAILGLRVTGPLDDLLLSARVYDAIVSRTALAAAFAGRPGVRVGELSVEVASLEPSSEGAVTLALPVQNGTTDPARPLPGRTGVYPVVVELRRVGGGRPVDRLVTAVAVLAPGVAPLTVAWVWTLDATPAHQPAGSLRPAARRAFSTGGRLSRLVEALEGAADTPLSIALSPETLEAWAEAAASPRSGSARESLERLRAQVSAPTRQLLAQPYAPLELASLSQAGLLEEAVAAHDRGAAALASVLGGPAPRGTLLGGTLDADSLPFLQRVGASRVVLDAASLAPAEERLTLARPFELGPVGSATVAVVADQVTSGLLAAEGPPRLLAARLVAELTLVALEAPAEARGLVMVPPYGWNPADDLLQATLAALVGHPVLQTATLDGLFGAVAPLPRRDGAPARRLSDGRPRASSGRLAVDPAEAAAQRRRLETFASVAGRETSAWASAERCLLLALSFQSGPSRPPNSARREAGRYLKGAKAAIDRVVKRVRAPDGDTLTLTARRAGIPILVQNGASVPVQVRLRLDSDKLTFPAGNERLLVLPPRASTEHFTVEAKTSGAFPLRISITSPDGSLLLTQSSLTIRSTAVSGAGALLTGAAGAFLLFWWSRELRQRRRRGRRQASQ